MKKITFILVALMLVVLGCVDFDEVTPEVKNSSGYTLQVNGVSVKDTVKYEIGELVLVEVLDNTGKKVIAEVKFGNGNAAVVADKVADKYTAAGTYKLTAAVVNTNPAVILTANVVIKKATVIPNPSSKEKIVIRIDSSYVNGINTMTYGLNLNEINNFNAANPVYVDASMPGKNWSTYDQFKEIKNIGGIQYLVFKISCTNGDVRLGWYQYYLKDGVQTKQWANTSTSVFCKDGLPEFSVYNGGTYKLGTTPTANVYTLKVGTETFASGSVIKVTEGASLTFKVVNSANQAVMATYTVTGANSVVADSKTVVYSTTGTYDVKIETQTDATVFTAKVEVTKPTVNVYTLKVGTETFASGSVIKVTEGASLTFKTVNSANQAVMATYTVTGANSVVADSKTVVYPTAGTYDVKIEIQADATIITAKVEVTKPIATVYTLKVDDQIVTDGATVKTTENKALYFKVVDSAGKTVLAKINFGNGTTVTTDGRSMSYATAGTYQVQVDVDAFTLKAKIEVTKIDVPVYTLKINNQVFASGSTFNTVEGASVSFKTVNSLGTAVIVSYNFGDNTSETTDNASKTYAKAGTYQVTVSNGSTVLATASIVVAVLPKPDIYDFRINGLAISGTAYLVEGASTSIKVVNIDGTAITAYMDLGNGTKLTTNNATVTYVAGTYTVSASIGNTTITKKIEVTKSIIVDPVKPESIVLISSSVSGSTINAIFGLRCGAINNFSSAKTTYVAGEIPGVNWKDYQLSEIVTINGVNYFKWSVSAPAGKYRMSWVQIRDGGTELYKGNWANDLNSLYWNVGEGLFLFNLSIDGSSAKLTN